MKQEFNSITEILDFLDNHTQEIRELQEECAQEQKATATEIEALKKQFQGNTIAERLEYRKKLISLEAKNEELEKLKEHLESEREKQIDKYKLELVRLVIRDGEKESDKLRDERITEARKIQKEVIKKINDIDKKLSEELIKLAESNRQLFARIEEYLDEDFLENHRQAYNIIINWGITKDFDYKYRDFKDALKIDL